MNPCGRVLGACPSPAPIACKHLRIARPGSIQALRHPVRRVRAPGPLAASTFERLEAGFRSTWREDLLPVPSDEEECLHPKGPRHDPYEDALDDLGLEHGTTYREPPKIWQGEVVAHLLGGSFDEVYLATVPTHTLNWVIKVSLPSFYGGGVHCLGSVPNSGPEESTAVVLCMQAPESPGSSPQQALGTLEPRHSALVIAPS